MDLEVESKEKLRGVSSQSSLQDESDSIGVYDLDSEDSTKFDLNLEDFGNTEEEGERSSKNQVFKDTDFFRVSCLTDELGSFKSKIKKENSLEEDDPLERALILAEGIRNLGKFQEENWRIMQDIILKKDLLIKQMADVMMCCKRRITPTESIPHDCEKEDFNSNLNIDNVNLIAEKENFGFWDQEDSISALGDLSLDDLSELSLEDFGDVPILEVPLGYGDDNEFGSAGSENLEHLIVRKKERDEV